jgi:hypothetical protein
LKNIALIACSNGYGHVRRLLLLAHALRKNGVNPVLFAPLQTVKRVAKSEMVACPRIVDFNTHTEREKWLNGTATDWIECSPNFSEYDIVISDNLIEILLIRPDAWLSGSFFWHESLKNFPKDLKFQALNLLKKYKPRMISSGIFVSDSVRSNTQVFEVGLYAANNNNAVHQNKRDALISCGKGGGSEIYVKEFVKLLAEREKPQFHCVWVEPSMLPNKYPDWMAPATFTHKMYQNIISAVIRPGVGTITSSLLSGSRIFPFYESGNKEMEFNALRVQSYNVGESTSTIDEAWIKAELFLVNKNSQKRHFKEIKGLDLCGAQQSAEIILSSLQ